MPKKKEVVISSSAINSYGYRVMTEGIDIEQYKKNPILLWGHHRTFMGTTNEVLPIGVIENIRIEEDKLIGTPVFDENDEFALKIKSKWDAGILKMVSPGLHVIEQSEDSEYLLPGQTRMSVTKSKLIEVSIVDIGANDEALTLYDKNGKIINLSNNEDCKIDKIKTKTINKMKEVSLKLGLSELATQEEVLMKLEELQGLANKAKDSEAKLAEYRKNAIEQEVNSAIQLKKISEEQKPHYIELGTKVGLEMLQQTLSHIRTAEKPSDVINKHSVGDDIKKLSDLSDDDKLKLRKEDKKEYARLYEVEYGIKPEI